MDLLPQDHYNAQVENYPVTVMFDNNYDLLHNTSLNLYKTIMFNNEQSIYNETNL